MQVGLAVGRYMLILFAGGARWLLLFVPVDLLERMGANIQLLGIRFRNRS
jgi:hypothetical protein